MRTREEAQQQLFKKFGIRDTAGFQAALRRGLVTKMEAALNYIIDNSVYFYHYDFFWLRDRRAELRAARLRWGKAKS
jgi:hypothetical protein